MESSGAEVSTVRLNLLRAVYLLIGLGMGIQVWPQIVTGSGNWLGGTGVVKSMLAALTLLCLLGLRYPLKMLPLLFWELVWKTVWLLVVALPTWRAGSMDAETAETAFACGFVVLVYAALPWRYVLRHYAGAAGERWKSS
jgi:hypothetical protein